MKITDRHVQLEEAMGPEDRAWVAERVAPGAGFPASEVSLLTVASLDRRQLDELETRIVERYRLGLDEEEGLAA